MTNKRKFELCIAQTSVQLLRFFPSVSNVKINLMPVDYVELLSAGVHPLFWVSAYDIANSPAVHRARLNTALDKSKKGGTAILIDSGNYEKFWKSDLA